MFLRFERSMIYFDPRSPCGERREITADEFIQALFRSTLPLRGATFNLVVSAQIFGISIHAPLAGSDLAFDRQRPAIPISIHAPLAGSDLGWSVLADHQSNFDPRSPCGERHHSPASSGFDCRDFDPRSPCGERLIEILTSRSSTIFRSTLPLRGATRRTTRDTTKPFNFDPRSPCGERPRRFSSYPRAIHISIHAPLAGSDHQVS